MKPVPLTKWKRRGRVAAKRFLYSQLLFKDAILVLLGREKPLVRFTVENDPPSIYLNFAIREDQVEAFERYIAVPMPLAPMACLDTDEPYYCLTLNMYRVSGLATGIRAEWSTYVFDSDGVPRYMVVDAECEKGTLDSVDLFTVKGHVGYTANDGDLELFAGASATSELRCTVTIPPDAPSARSAHQWVTANDYIYWRNGVCDRTFYDAGLADAAMVELDPATATITDSSQWADFLEPHPRSVLAFTKSIEFAMSPWWNL
ncbi:MAG: hypothetical protein ACI9C1_001760 [Candidatus Aldehydirespiratoraceae bacterium]|jgi:hypothetical protein